MEALSKKIYLVLDPPTEEDPRADKQRILDGLPESLGAVTMGLKAMRSLYPTCEKAGWRITVSLTWNGSCWEIYRVEPGDTRVRSFGIATDLGSTTVCMRLIDLNTGKILAQSSAYNRQIAFGEDILTRVFYCKDQPERLEEVRLATIETFREVMHDLSQKSGLDLTACGSMVVAGNTTMMHFFLGLDPFSVFASPYAPRASSFGFLRGADLGLPMEGYVFSYPCLANYLGGDIISGMVATELPEREGISVFLDIGTNGELVVGNRHFLLSGAGAAGPALEGGVVKTGMRAVDGAVSAVRLENGTFHLTVLGGGTPKGLCGSGIVDLIAQLYLAGYIDLRGKFTPEAPNLAEDNGNMGICYGPGLYFWESDIQAFLNTKAAANTMVEYMLDQIGIPMDQVDRFYVAGAFGTHLDKESAVTIGLYPDIARERIISAGNSSLEGAQLLLCNKDKLELLESILEKMEYVQFGAVADFIDRMRAARAIPHTDMRRYPSVQEKLAKRK